MSAIGVGTRSLFEVDVLEPEHEVVGGERRAVGPLHALAQEEREDLAVVADLPALGERRARSWCRCSPRTASLSSRRDAVAVLDVARAGEAAAPGAAVLADLSSGLMTSGSCGTRCSTGGSLPALTSSASIGACLSFFGRGASTRTMGPSSLPMSELPRGASWAARRNRTGRRDAAAGRTRPAAAAPFIRPRRNAPLRHVTHEPFCVASLGPRHCELPSPSSCSTSSMA